MSSNKCPHCNGELAPETSTNPTKDSTARCSKCNCSFTKDSRLRTTGANCSTGNVLTNTVVATTVTTADSGMVATLSAENEELQAKVAELEAELAKADEDLNAADKEIASLKAAVEPTPKAAKV